MGLHGIKQYKLKSVKSINQCESVIQTMYDIIEAHGGELNVETTIAESTTFQIKLPIS
jgi:light-regulated signal transduction histidine kinase (bacteriophytochrome)